MSDQLEVYIATMEAERNSDMDAYYFARPKEDTPEARAIFRAGYERGFCRAWNRIPVADSEGSTARKDGNCAHNGGWFGASDGHNYCLKCDAKLST